MITLRIAKKQAMAPATKFDENGKEVPWEPGEHEALVKEAEGKIFYRVIAETDEQSPQHLAIHSRWVDENNDLELEMVLAATCKAIMQKKRDCL